MNDRSAFMDFQQSSTRVFHRCHGTSQVLQKYILKGCYVCA